ncbi:hypothetical protein VHUM_00776 [Vanrija humicola]|uniref:Major facilitator superfamily (MFS) profile domain-containing protein n=1 Tax=Vanrija humicola TaxID=5417 RepID=A0A7D8Z2N6_VANHU|nr:hypothetical protein VHUM_00776 [Vanrija humicola]
MARYTSTQIAAATKPSLINYVAAIFAATGSFLFGYDSGIISSVISPSYTHFHSYFNNPSDSIIGAIVAVFGGGAFVGSLIAGQTADWIGRKRTIQLGCVIAIVGCTLQTAAVNAAMLIVGRLIAGCSVGVLSMIVPVYQAEISPPHARGLLSGWTQMMIAWGFFAANWVGYGTGFINGNGQWRIPLGIQLVPAVLLLLGMFVLPYSPRWLAKQGRTDEARSTLVRLHGGSKNANLDIVDAEIQQMVEQIEWERDNLTTSYAELFNSKPNLHRTLCGMLVQAMTQWTGCNVNNYYGTVIYTALGYTDSKTLLINGIQGAWGVICTFVFITFIVDRIGRRWPLIIGGFMCGVAMAWEAGANAPFDKAKRAGEVYHSTGTGIAGIAAVFFFSLTFSFSFGPVSWIYQSEIFPMHMRALGTSVSAATNWLNNVIIGQITPIAFNKIGYKYFIVFAVCGLSNAIISYFLFPETKNKTLEEIGLLFGDTNVRVAPDQIDEENEKKAIEHVDRV